MKIVYVIVVFNFCIVGNFEMVNYNPILHHIGNYYDRYVKFDLVPVPNQRKVSIKSTASSKRIIRKQTTKMFVTSDVNSKYLWDDIGKFWTYRKRNDYDENRYGKDFSNGLCQPPFCLPRNCDKLKCPRMDCMQPRRRCPYEPEECGFGQISVRFGRKVVCMNNDQGDSCTPSCGPKGMCIQGKCYCEMGYHGQRCLVMDVELCKSKNGLICAEGCSKDELSNKYKCVCSDDEFRPDCLEMRICATACQNSAVCVSGKCQCTEEFYGPSCEFDVGPCSPGQIGNRTCKQICVSNGKDRFMCKCRDEYVLNKDGQTCDRKQCFENGTSIIFDGKCQCREGWKGKLCDQDVNECATENRCRHICRNTQGAYECQCRDGFRLMTDGNCVQTCKNNCSEHGDCLNGVCHCFYGWHGEDCVLDIDECKYIHNCQYKCENKPGSYSCLCPEGQELLADKRQCAAVQCGGKCYNGGTCVNNKCVCTPEFIGVHCETVNLCQMMNPCSQKCSITNDQINCSCNAGYELQPDGRSCIEKCQCGHGRCVDRRCVCNDGYQGTNCTEDINECVSKVHECDQICDNTNGSFVCSCYDGYEIMPDGKTCGQKQCPVCIRGRCIRNRCICPAGFYGEKCEHDINECSNTTLCEHFCTNTVGSYLCSCQAGYQLHKNGRRCHPIINSTCQILGCLRGQCINDKCICPNGFTGSRCESDINECNFGSVCSQICLNEIGSFKCSCVPGFVLASDQKSCIQECPKCEKGVCKNGRCVCPTGYHGDRCQFDVDECLTTMGICDQLCINTPGSFHCACHNNYVLKSDGRTCKKWSCSSACQNGFCLNGKCVCNTGFKGDQCEEDIDECMSGEHRCQHICENTIGGFRCRCNNNYMLSPDDRSCQPNKCGACVHGKCQSDGKCVCNSGFAGSACDKDIDECTVWRSVCQHTCLNTVGSYKCLCKPGYRLSPDKHSCNLFCSLCKNGLCNPVSGRCQCKKGWHGELCDLDVDECKLNTHKCQHICINTNGSYECSCQPNHHLSNFDGRSCLKSDSNCLKDCKNNGKCVNAKCKCSSGFKGDSCEEDIDECQRSHPTHGCMGECRNTFGNYECICPQGYVQLNDQKTCKVTSKDTMCSPPCQNGGSCRDRSRCFCTLGFEGADCASDVDECTRYKPCDKLHGICSNTHGSYYCQCSNGYVLMFDATSCMTVREAILRPHLRYRGRGTKGYIPPFEK